jgi:hypothetical protein
VNPQKQIDDTTYVAETPGHEKDKMIQSKVPDKSDSFASLNE